MFYGFFFFKQKTAYEMRISDWSSDVCSSDFARGPGGARRGGCRLGRGPRLHEIEAAGLDAVEIGDVVRRDVGGRPVVDDAAFLQRDGAVAVLEGMVDLVQRDDHRGAVLEIGRAQV